MAIAKLLKADVVCLAEQEESLLSALERARIIHIEDVHKDLEEKIPEENPPEDPGMEAGLQKAKAVLDTFSAVDPVKKGLLENFFGSPPYIEELSFHDIVKGIDLDDYEKRIREMTSEIESLHARAETLSELASLLEPWTPLAEKLSNLNGMRFTSVFPVVGLPMQVDSLLGSATAAMEDGDAAWAEVDRTEKRAVGVLLAEASAASQAEAWLRDAELAHLSLPDTDETPKEARDRALGEMEAISRRIAEIESVLRAEASGRRREIQAVYDERANLRKKTQLRGKTLRTRHVTVVRGWVLERDRTRLEELLLENIPGAEIEFSPPAKGDAPPVMLENPRILRPFQILLELFGLPQYSGIDSTWFVAMAMTIFYSMCLGDAGYGAMQILISLWLLRKFKPAEGTRLFLQLFAEMGVGAFIFGILTWSFFGTSPGYTGGAKVLGIFPIISPQTQILQIIAVAAAIGVVFQLASIMIACVASFKAGDVKAAILDKLSWFLFLLGLLVVLGYAALGLPLFVLIMGIVVGGPGALTILLFSGRNSKSIVGRLGVGLISFYGIVGYYGAVSFFGDVLSYLRLAILNLTSSFIAFVANIIGTLLFGGSTIVFVILTAIIAALPVLLFHTLNLILSMMGAFVHSLRLNYLESFSRYYGSGGKPFAPCKKEGLYYRFEQ